MYVTVTEWTKTNNEFSELASNVVNGVLKIDQDGIYIVSFTARFERVVTGYRIGVFINGTEFLQGREQVDTVTSETMALSLAMDLKYQDNLEFKVFAEGSGMELIPGTSHSILRLDELGASNLTEGLSGYKVAPQDFIDGINTIKGWDTKNTRGTFLAKNVSLTDAGALVVLRPGVFRLTMAIIVDNEVATSRYSIHLNIKYF